VRITAELAASAASLALVLDLLHRGSVAFEPAG
jgi:hypothetical protein